MRATGLCLNAGMVLLLVHSPLSAQSCPWRPWFSDWAHLDAYNPGSGDADPGNWDYLGAEPTSLGGDGLAHTGSHALHFFSGNPIVPGSPDGYGSGGIYQEIMATRGTPIDVSVWTKGKSLAGGGGGGWFEVMIIEGPFATGAADQSPSPADLVFKRDTFPDQAFPDPSPTWMNATGSWNNWSSPTPAEPALVTVVLKAGTVTFGGSPALLEAFFDDAVVSQSGGPNLLVNGDFEDATQALNCQHEEVFQDEDQDNYFFGAGSAEVCTGGSDEDGDTLTDCADPDCAASSNCVCNEPFADADGDEDVDLDDFSRFQRCYTGPAALLETGCECFDRAGGQEGGPDGHIDEADFARFVLCAGRANVSPPANCED